MVIFRCHIFYIDIFMLTTTPSHPKKNKGLYTTLGWNALEMKLQLHPSYKEHKETKQRKSCIEDSCRDNIRKEQIRILKNLSVNICATGLTLERSKWSESRTKWRISTEHSTCNRIQNIHFHVLVCCSLSPFC